jgi:hypothetical protein
MRFGVTIFTALAMLMVAPSSAKSLRPLTSVAAKVSDVATDFCVDVLSLKVSLPADLKKEAKLFARYGLASGLPNSAMQALGRDVSLVAQATLASAQASDGSFMVALGGRAGQTCRIIVYGTGYDSILAKTIYQAMQQPASGWHALPVATQPANALKLSLIKRDPKRQPFLTNLLSPTEIGPIAMVATVAAIPPQVVIPEGY